MEFAATAMIIVLLVAMACGLEITWSLGLSCVVAVLLDPKLTFVVVAQRIFAGSNSFTMLAIPAFMLAGDIMSKGGLSKRLVSFADSLVGWISGGIYGGFFTPTESAVIAVVYGMAVCLAVYREISGKTLWDIIEATATGTANLMILVVTAQMFGWLISYYQIPQAVSAFMLSFVSNKYMFWAIIILLLTICGMFLEVGATNLILGPILAPIAGAFGIDPVHFGLVFVFLLAMGQATPPFGTCMFVSCGISQQPVSKVSKELVPFVAVEIACAVIFALVPAISTFLPSIIS